MATKYDAIVIGTGQAGPSLAVRLADTAMKVAIIERKRFGAGVNRSIMGRSLLSPCRKTHRRLRRKMGRFRNRRQKLHRPRLPGGLIVRPTEALKDAK